MQPPDLAWVTDPSQRKRLIEAYLGWVTQRTPENEWADFAIHDAIWHYVDPEIMLDLTIEVIKQLADNPRALNYVAAGPLEDLLGGTEAVMRGLKTRPGPIPRSERPSPRFTECATARRATRCCAASRRRRDPGCRRCPRDIHTRSGMRVADGVKGCVRPAMPATTSPPTGQFLTRDPEVATTLSPYGYVGGNPLNASDPRGECGTSSPDVSGS